MGRNNRFINSVKRIAEQNRNNNLAEAADEITPQIYAAMAIALHRKFGFGADRINRVFMESQDIWLSFSGNGKEMIETCEKETGVRVVRRDMPE